MLPLFFGLVVGAFGQPVFNPSLIRLGAVLGSRTPLTTKLILHYNSSPGDQSFTLSIRHTGASTNWLRVTPTSGTAPAQLAVSVDPSNLAEGTHTAQIVAYVGNLSLAATATVSLVVGPSGVSAGGLAVSPSSLTFQPNVSTDPQILTVSNAPGVTGPIAYVASVTTAQWLSIVQSGQTAPGTVRVQILPSGLQPGTHTAAVILTASTGKTTVVPVSILVPQESIGSTISLTPAQRELTFNFQLNSSLNPLQTVYITTDSSEYTYFTASTATPWIGVAAAAWITPAATADCFAPGLFYVAVDPTGLPAGVHHGSVRLEAPSAAAVEIPVTLTVSSLPVLNTNPSFISLDTTSNTLSSNLAITASTPLFFAASVTGNTPWLKLSSSSGIATDNPVNLTVTATTTNLPSGRYHGAITLVGPAGQPTLTVPVELRVTEANVENAVSFSPQTIEFTAVSGDSAPSQYTAISSDLGTLDEFSIASVAEGGWLTAELMSSPRGYVKISVNTGAVPGLYSGSVKATSLRTGHEATATVNFRLQARTFTVAPATLAFRQASTGAAVASQELQVTSNRSTTFRIAGQPEWATIQAPDGLTTPAKLVVSVKTGALLPGPYEGSIRLSGPIDVVVPVSLVIPEPAPPTASPAAISFVHDLGGPSPPSQSVTVSNPTGSVRFSAQASTASGIEWLQAEPASGSTPGAIALRISTSRLTPGQHSATLTVRVETTPVKTLTVPITLAVRGSAVQVNSVLGAATLQPTALSPGLLVTLGGLGLGPEAPVVARSSAAGSFPTQLAGVQLYFDGVAAPLLLVSSEQINAIVPYSVQGRTSTKIQAQNGQGYSIPIEAKVVDAAPGIFTQGQTGRGPAVALNADFTINTALNPARPGAIVIVYMTGEGQTDPPGQDGRVITTDLRKPLLPVTATVGGKPAEVLYAGSAPQSVSGICQVNLRLPEDVAPGSLALEIQVGGAPSQRGVSIEVQ